MINQMMGIASSDLDVFILIATVLLGLCLGSFATALVHRIPRRQSWIISHSLCPSCGHRLAWFDLFPVLSWVALRGQCRYCKAPIAKRYPLIELTTLILCVVAEMIFGFTAQGIVVMLAIPFLVALVAIDLEYMILPDQLNVILWLLGLLYVCFSAGSAELPQALLAAVVYAGLSFVTSICTSLALKKVAMGMGDVKFFAVAGLWLGLPVLPAFLIIAGVSGLALGLFWKQIKKEARFPFGPALIVSFLICLAFLPQITALIY